MISTKLVNAKHHANPHDMNVVHLSNLSVKSSGKIIPSLQTKTKPPKATKISKHLFDKAHIFQILEIHNGRCQTNKGKKQNEDLGAAEFFQAVVS